MRRRPGSSLLLLVCALVGVLATPVFAARRGNAGTFPGDNGLLLFDTGCVPPCQGGLVTLSPSGGSRTLIVDSLDLNGRVPVDPDWSSDGTRVAFHAGDAGTASSELYTADADGTNIAQITSDLVTDRWPSWEPGGDSLVYERNQHIWAIAADGSDPVRLTRKIGIAPAVSPDGRRVVFVGYLRQSDGRNGAQIFRMRLDGSRLTHLTTSHRLNSQPSWSPDGTRIVFLRGRAGSIMVMRSDGTEEREVLHKEGASSPIFSPDGNLLAYVDPGEALIKLVRPNGRDKRTLANSEGAMFRVAWAPAR